MPYAPNFLVLQAVSEIAGAHPLAVVTIPALLRDSHALDKDPVREGIPFGSANETELLNEFFLLPRPPDPDRPWRAPWSASEPWQKRKYPGGGLQRLRTDNANRGRLFVKIPNPGEGAKDIWRLTPEAGPEMMAMETPPKAVRLIDLAIWFGRRRDVENIRQLYDWFVETFDVDRAGLLDTVYLSDIPDGYLDAELQYAPIDELAPEDLGSRPVAPTIEQPLDEVVGEIENQFTREHFVLAAGLVRRAITAWLRGDIVVLVGQPGTGKTLFANLIGRFMESTFALDPPITIPVTSDFDESEFIGYERLDGEAQLRDFAVEVLQTDEPLRARVIILEEFNLVPVERYLSSVLVAAQQPERLVRMPAGLTSHLPIDAFIIATCNSYRDEPETRTRISSPTKRRATVITMPNVLAVEFENDPDGAVVRLAVDLILNERLKVQSRVAAQDASQFDGIRLRSLETIDSANDLSDAVKMALTDVSASILTTSQGRSWFTLGILRDVAAEIAYAARDEHSEMSALGHAIADKVIHQLRGTHTDIIEFQEACATLPNAAEIAELLDRILDGPADELLSLL